MILRGRLREVQPEGRAPSDHTTTHLGGRPGELADRTQMNSRSAGQPGASPGGPRRGRLITEGGKPRAAAAQAGTCRPRPQRRREYRRAGRRTGALEFGETLFLLTLTWARDECCSTVSGPPRAPA